MKNRRDLMLTLIAAFVALTVVIGPAIAAELMGRINSVDVEGKKVTVVEKDSDKEVVVTVTDDTDFVTAKGSNKIDLEKLAKNVAKAKEAGKTGPMYRVTHEKRVASKIEQGAKKKD
jgi:hypothetical protein